MDNKFSNLTALNCSLIDQVMTVTLNRPAQANALNTVMIQELLTVWSELYVDSQGVRVVILTGAGERAFCGGADLKERCSMDYTAWARQHAILEQVMKRMVECPVPIIAAVNGPALGGGVELCLAADFVYAASEAHFGMPEVTRGIIPGAMGTQLLPKAIGERRAREVILTGGVFSATEAQQWGLVNKLFPRAELMAKVTAVATQICEQTAPFAVQCAKKSLRVASDGQLEIGYRFEIEAHLRSVDTADREEGLRAFVEKRAPVFRGI